MKKKTSRCKGSRQGEIVHGGLYVSFWTPLSFFFFFFEIKKVSAKRSAALFTPFVQYDWNWSITNITKCLFVFFSRCVLYINRFFCDAKDFPNAFIYIRHIVRTGGLVTIRTEPILRTVNPKNIENWNQTRTLKKKKVPVPDWIPRL